jgi:hypothetical protein
MKPRQPGLFHGAFCYAAEARRAVRMSFWMRHSRPEVVVKEYGRIRRRLDLTSFVWQLFN